MALERVVPYFSSQADALELHPQLQRWPPKIQKNAASVDILNISHRYLCTK
jgi:hypothetical protein